MKSRNIFAVYKNHPSVQPETVIKIVVASFLAMLIFAGGFIFSWFLLEKPLNDDEFAFCETIAQNVYSNGQQFLTGMQKRVSVAIDDTTITVSLADITRRGKIIAELHDGELVMTRNFETGKAIFTSILIALTLLLVCAAIFIGIFMPSTSDDSKS